MTAKVGTHGYMAPEVWKGERVVKPELRRKVLFRYNSMVDSWSLGIVVLECYSGKVPENPAEVSIKDKKLAEIVDGLLQQNPEDRSYLHDLLEGDSKQNNVYVET